MDSVMSLFALFPSESFCMGHTQYCSYCCDTFASLSRCHCIKTLLCFIFIPPIRFFALVKCPDSPAFTKIHYSVSFVLTEGKVKCSRRVADGLPLH